MSLKTFSQLFAMDIWHSLQGKLIYVAHKTKWIILLFIFLLGFQFPLNNDEMEMVLFFLNWFVVGIRRHTFYPVLFIIVLVIQRNSIFRSFVCLIWSFSNISPKVHIIISMGVFAICIPVVVSTKNSQMDAIFPTLTAGNMIIYHKNENEREREGGQ